MQRQFHRVVLLCRCYIEVHLIRGRFATLLGRQIEGSIAAPGFMKPEGIIIYHTAANQYFKKTIDGDDVWKDQPKNAETTGDIDVE